MEVASVIFVCRSPTLSESDKVTVNWPDGPRTLTRMLCCILRNSGLHQKGSWSLHVGVLRNDRCACDVKHGDKCRPSTFHATTSLLAYISANWTSDRERSRTVKSTSGLDFVLQESEKRPHRRVELMRRLCRSHFPILKDRATMHHHRW